jgi:hypothetical protein
MDNVRKHNNWTVSRPTKWKINFQDRRDNKSTVCTRIYEQYIDELAFEILGIEEEKI